MNLIALITLLFIFPYLAGYCIKTEFKIGTLGRLPIYDFLRERPRLEGKLEPDDIIAWYQVYPNNEKLNMTFYAVWILHNRTSGGIYFKIHVKNDKLYHLSNFTREEYQWYFRNCSSR